MYKLYRDETVAEILNSWNRDLDEFRKDTSFGDMLGDKPYWCESERIYIAEGWDINEGLLPVVACLYQFKNAPYVEFSLGSFEGINEHALASLLVEARVTAKQKAEQKRL